MIPSRSAPCAPSTDALPSRAEIQQPPTPSRLGNSFGQVPEAVRILPPRLGMLKPRPRRCDLPQRSILFGNVRIGDIQQP